jgi:hypothetical protein
MEVGLGSLVVVVIDFLNFFLVVLVLVVVLVLLVLSISSAVKAVKSLLANKLIFCMRVFFDGGGTTLSSDVSRSPDF